MLLEINEYAPITNEAGVRVIQDTGHNVYVNPSQINSVSTNAVVGFEADGETEIDVFRVQFNDGTHIWTDADEITVINAWLFPIELATDAVPA
jgi:hypothetical protein